MIYRIEFFDSDDSLGEPSKAIHYKATDAPITSLSHGPICGTFAGKIMWLTDNEAKVTCGRCRSRLAAAARMNEVVDFT